MKKISLKDFKNSLKRNEMRCISGEMTTYCRRQSNNMVDQRAGSYWPSGSLYYDYISQCWADQNGPHLYNIVI